MNYVSYVNTHYPCSKSLLSPFLRAYFDCSSNHVALGDKSCLDAFPSSKKFWMLLSNAQSIFYKMDELRALVQATKPTIVCITESWLTPDIDNDIIQMNDYYSFRNDRQDNPNDIRKGGGVLVYVAPSVRPINVDIPAEFVCPFGIETCIVAFYEPGLSFLLCIYIPPGILAHVFQDFEQYVIQVFDFLLSKSPEADLFVCGDLNQYDFSFLSQSFDLCNIVDFPTFHDSALDKFFCHRDAAGSFAAVSSPPLGSANHAHKVVFISKNVLRSSGDDLLYKVYDLRQSNVESFRNVLAKVDWSRFASFSSVDDCCQFFYENLYHAMTAIPVSFVRFKSKTKPWITPVVLDLINKRWRAYRSKNFDLYNHYKKKVFQEIAKSKKIWSDKMCKSSKGFWSLVSNVRGKNAAKSVHCLFSLFDNAVEAVESINERFSKFFCKNEPFCKIVSCEHVNEALVICNKSLVHTLLSNLKTDKAIGSDMIPPVLLKRCAAELSSPLCYIFNYSFKHASVPILWKLADICPLPKTSPVKIDQLRPISLLPCVSKIFEKIVLNTYHSCLIECFDESQFAYKPNSSTVLALLSMHDNMVKVFDDPHVRGFRVIAFDLSHAFDSVPHHLLLHRLHDFRDVIPNFVYLFNWLCDYLNNRQQRVRLGNVKSSTVHVSSGVPQGSILGPILFAIFISSYQPISKDVHITKYADDVTLCVPVYKSDLSDLQRLQNEVEHFTLWCHQHCMTINQSKTKILNVCFGRLPLSPVPDFDNVMCLKILGLIFNCKLDWSDHLACICSKVSRRLYILRVLKPFFSHNQLVYTFNQTIRSILEYASPVFLNPGLSFDVKLDRLCKRAFRIIHGKNTKSCNECLLFNLAERRRSLAMRIFSAAREDTKHVLHDIIPRQSSRSSRLLLPKVNTKRRAKGFAFSCAKTYNDTL